MDRKLIVLFLFTAISAVAYSQTPIDGDIFTKVKTTTGTTNYTALQLKTYIASSVGSVSSISIDSSLGLSGIVLNPTTTPVLRLKTLSSITGLMKSTNGTVSQAVSGTDYVIPSGSISGTAGNVTGTVAVANGGTGLITIPTGAYVIGNGTSTVTTSTTIPTTALQGTITNAQLFNNSTSANNVTLTLGGTNATAFTLQNVTTAGANSTVASAFSGGLTASTGGFTSTGTATIGSIVNTEGTLITSTSTLPITSSNLTVNNAGAITLTIPTGLPTGYTYYVKIADTAAGVITLSATTDKVFNSTLTTGTISNGAALNYTLVKGLTYWTVN